MKLEKTEFIAKEKKAKTLDQFAKDRSLKELSTAKKVGLG